MAHYANEQEQERSFIYDLILQSLHRWQHAGLIPPDEPAAALEQAAAEQADRVLRTLHSNQLNFAALQVATSWAPT